MTTTFPEGSYAFDVALQPDGKIIAAGTVFVDFNPGDIPIPILPWPDITPMEVSDTTFGNGGTLMTDFFGNGRRRLFGLDPTRRKDCRGRLRQ